MTIKIEQDKDYRFLYHHLAFRKYVKEHKLVIPKWKFEKCSLYWEDILSVECEPVYGIDIRYTGYRLVKKSNSTDYKLIDKYKTRAAEIDYYGSCTSHRTEIDTRTLKLVKDLINRGIIYKVVTNEKKRK